MSIFVTDIGWEEYWYILGVSYRDLDLGKPSLHSRGGSDRRTSNLLLFGRISSRKQRKPSRLNYNLRDYH